MLQVSSRFDGRYVTKGSRKPSGAQEIAVSKGKCGANVHVTARKARLSEVLKRLSQALDFQLQYESSNDPIIDIDLSRPAPPEPDN